LKNRVSQEQYFPGSTFKIITTAAAMNENIMQPQETFFCDLVWTNGARYGDTLPSRSDWRRLEPPDSPVSKAAGSVTPAQALAASCNPFFYEMGARLYVEDGPTTLFDYARRLGLGFKTGLEPVLPEVAGNIRPPASVEQAINNAIGQGETQVTIIQMARMVAAIANGGKLYRPYLVQQVGGVGGQPPSFTAQAQMVDDAGISEAALQVVREGMCAVTTDTTLGTAWGPFEATSYWACGKTGTAQSGRTQPHSWFVAFAPRENPQVAVVVMAEFSREGSEVAAPITRRILDAYFGQPVWSYPSWWSEGPYVPLSIPSGETGG
jgi:penicillin-binding protein 2